MWKYEPNLGPTKTEPEQHWALQPPSTVGEPIAEITVWICIHDARMVPYFFLPLYILNI